MGAVRHAVALRPPKTRIWRTGNVVYSVGRRPNNRSVHFLLFATDDTWRVCCTGRVVTADFHHGVSSDTQEVTCAICLRKINWSGEQRRGFKY